VNVPFKNVLGPPLQDEGWLRHPVWGHMGKRHEAFRQGLAAMLRYGAPAETDNEHPWRAPLHAWLERTLGEHALAAYALMGIPPLRLQHGAAFAPPVLRFADAQICTARAAGMIPWHLTAEELTGAVEEAESRHKVLREADFAAKYNIAPGSFSK
jgi:hypothetical protein